MARPKKIKDVWAERPENKAEAQRLEEAGLVKDFAAKQMAVHEEVTNTPFIPKLPKPKVIIIDENAAERKEIENGPYLVELKNYIDRLKEAGHTARLEWTEGFKVLHMISKTGHMYDINVAIDHDMDMPTKLRRLKQILFERGVIV